MEKNYEKKLFELKQYDLISQTPSVYCSLKEMKKSVMEKIFFVL
jgi:hypothetical protein